MKRISAALGHDYLLVMRGAERTFLEMTRLWPEAPIYTTLHSEIGTLGMFCDHEIITSPLQKLQRLGLHQRRGFRFLLPFFPAAVRRLRPRGHDVLVTSSSAFAIGIQPETDVPHVCYCHTPFRYAHHERERALGEVPRPVRPALDLTLRRIRRSDIEAAARVHTLVANSEATRTRIGDLYGRESTVVYPPVDVARFNGGLRPEPHGEGERGEYFLCVTELVAHKGVEIALEATRLAGGRIVLVGDGPERDGLRARFSDVCEFRGRVSDAELAKLLRGAKAVVVPTVEEFGIVAVEAQAAGAPVVAPAAGGTLETVIDGRTGLLVPERTPAAFAEAMQAIGEISWDPVLARTNAGRFSPDVFRERLGEVVAAAAA